MRHIYHLPLTVCCVKTLLQHLAYSDTVGMGRTSTVNKLTALIRDRGQSRIPAVRPVDGSGYLIDCKTELTRDLICESVLTVTLDPPP